MLSHSGINLSSSIFQKNADTLSAFSMLLRVTLAVSPAIKSLLTILIPVNTPFLYPATINDAFFISLLTVTVAVPFVLSTLSFGISSLGDEVGVAVGVAVGFSVGVDVGVAVGIAVGVAVGIAVGIAVGVAVGIAVGVAVGIAVGVAVGVGLGVAVGVTSRANGLNEYVRKLNLFPTTFGLILSL